VRYRREKGIALVTSILILLLLSTMIAGFAWMVMGDRALGGNYQDRQLAFYGAEAGMESLTAALENLFNSNYAPTAASLTGTSGIVNTAPSNLVPGVQYLNPDGTNGYVIKFPTNAGGNPQASPSNISNGTYAGLQGLMTPYTIQVTSRTGFGSEVRLTRTVQTVAIPVFQFGVFSANDLDYFAEPNFNFGGRVHSNGNLWLAELTGSTLTMGGAVTAGGEIITSNLENGYATSSIFAGPVNITTGGAGYANLRSQSPAQSVSGTTNNIASIGAYNPAFATMASSVYGASNLAVKETGGKVFNVSIATPQIGGQEIDMIRRPVHGEDGSNLPKLQERYWHQVGLRILLSDYGSAGNCTTSDIAAGSSTALPELSANLSAGLGTPQTPVDLATLAWDTSNTTPPAGTSGAAPLWITSYVGNPVFPLPVSGAASASATPPSNGYWIKPWYPTIAGCLKIEYQDSNAAWHDVTDKILELGYTGRDINPQTTSVALPGYPALPAAGTQVAAQGPTVKTGVTMVVDVAAGANCADPSPNAVIRLARVRDNPSWYSTVSHHCNGWPTTATPQHGTDFWPNVLFDSREGELIDYCATGVSCGGTIPTAGNAPMLSGAMYYVELDVKNLAACLTGSAAPFSTLCSWAGSVTNSNGEGYSVYFSDRRNEQPDPNPPASVGGTSALTGGYGFDDVVNAGSTYGCPASLPSPTLDTGENLEGDYVNGVDPAPLPGPRHYGNWLTSANSGTYWPYPSASTAWNLALGSGVGGTGMNNILANSPNCTGLGVLWPFATLIQTAGHSTQELRMNPPIFFRRALKIMDGYSISIGAANACNGVNCGLTIASENPVYVQGDFNNNPTTDATFATPGTDAHVGTSIVADAITALSDNWNDVNSFISPYHWGGRAAVATTYRFAFMAGEGVPFVQPTRANDVAEGTDGGVHNLLRYIERWNTATDLPFTANSATSVPSYYLGSMVSTYYDHQAVGIWKCCNGSVYDPPQRNYAFDQDFQTPAKLPPLTPMLRDINTIGYTQLMLPTQ
jgi:type IV pilus assembly PilX-like protein